MKMTVSEREEPQHIPEGTMLNATFTSVEDFEFTAKDTGEIVERWRWNFTFTQPGPYQGWKVSGLTPRWLATDSRSRAMTWLQAISGMSFDVDDEIDVTAYYGRPVKIVVGIRPKGDRVWNTVEDVLPHVVSATDTFG